MNTTKQTVELKTANKEMKILVELFNSIQDFSSRLNALNNSNSLLLERIGITQELSEPIRNINDTNFIDDIKSELSYMNNIIMNYESITRDLSRLI